MSALYIKTEDGIEILDYTHRADLRLSAMNFLEYRHNKKKKRKGLFCKLASILKGVL